MLSEETIRKILDDHVLKLGGAMYWYESESDISNLKGSINALCLVLELPAGQQFERAEEICRAKKRTKYEILSERIQKSLSDAKEAFLQLELAL